MSAFRDCIVSFIDLNDMGQILRRESRRGVQIMRQFHRVICNRVHELTAHKEVCFWQDSVLLLGLVDSTKASYYGVMNDVRALHEAVGRLHPSHVVCIKGQSFPAPTIRSSNHKPHAIYLSASSLAFSNCFDVEQRLKRYHADWYIDSRITAKIDARTPDNSAALKLLPGNVSRDIHMFRGSFGKNLR
jgi:hypothetical protein